MLSVAVSSDGAPLDKPRSTTLNATIRMIFKPQAAADRR